MDPEVADPRTLIEASALIDLEMASFTQAIALESVDLKIYLHLAGGPVKVTGGGFGQQTIQSLPISSALYTFIGHRLLRLDRLLALDFAFTSKVGEADVAIYLDTEIQTDLPLTLGIAVQNTEYGRSWWEIFLNGTALADDTDYLHYALIHELGHSLGLEHPFDNSDGDFYGSRLPELSAYPEQTVMSYREPLLGSWPTWFTSSDLNALITLWGAESTPPIARVQPKLFAPTRSERLTPSLLGSTLVISEDDRSRSIDLVCSASSDFLEIHNSADVLIHLTAASSPWTSDAYAINFGSTASSGTRQRISLVGKARYFQTIDADDSAYVAVQFQDKTDAAFFLHDAYSPIYGDVSRLVDSSGRPCAPRFAGIDVVFMETAGGTSIVDLSSPDFITGDVTVYGASQGTSIFWGSNGHDSFISRGGDSLIYGGSGVNSFYLGAGVDVLQYHPGQAAADVVYGFNPVTDVLELWTAKDAPFQAPRFSTSQGVTTMDWMGNSVVFLLADDDNRLTTIARTIDLALI